MQIFITATGTNIGKTIVSTWLIHQLNTVHNKNYFYWKPIQSGVSEDDDTHFVSKFTNNIYRPTYSFNQPLSPHLAADLSNEKIFIKKILKNKPDNPNLIIEGAGGILVPINKSQMIIDLIIQLKVPVLIVCNSELGTINHTCLTIEALRSRNIKILGVIMNGKKNLENKLAIENYGKIQVVQEIEYFQKIETLSLSETELQEQSISTLLLKNF